MSEQPNPYSDYRLITAIRQPEFSEWCCYLFGSKPGSGGIVWRPHKGKEPNWFWREMQWLILGNLWVKEDD